MKTYNCYDIFGRFLGTVQADNMADARKLAKQQFGKNFSHARPT